MPITKQHGKEFGKTGAVAGVVATASAVARYLGAEIPEEETRNFFNALGAVEGALIPLLVTIGSTAIGWVSHELVVLEEKEAERLERITEVERRTGVENSE